MFGLAAFGRGVISGRVLEVIVRNHLEALARCEQVMARRHLVDALEHRAIAVGDHVQILEHRLVIPARGHAGREQRLRFRRDVELAFVVGVEERLDPKAVARREEQPAALVPDYERELAAQFA